MAVSVANTRERRRFLAGLGTPCLPPGFHIHFQEQALLHYEKSTLWLIIAVKRKVRLAFVTVYGAL